MELKKCNVVRPNIVVSPIGDIQYSGKEGPTAHEHVKRHIDRVLALETKDTAVRFIGMGDYIDFLSPSNRQRLTSANLYDTAKMTIEDKARTLTEEVFEELLKPTVGKWLGLLEGHHFFEFQGTTSDITLAEMLKAPFLGTSAYVRLEPSGVVLYAHHGMGGGILPTSGINKLYHHSAGLHGADVYLMGHNTKLAVSRLSRPTPDWRGKNPNLTHSDVLLVNTGGFSKSNIVGHRQGRIPRGDYAEQGMMTPSPLAAPLIHINGNAEQHERVRVEI